MASPVRSAVIRVGYPLSLCLLVLAFLYVHTENSKESVDVRRGIVKQVTAQHVESSDREKNEVSADIGTHESTESGGEKVGKTVELGREAKIETSDLKIVTAADNTPRRLDSAEPKGEIQQEVGFYKKLPGYVEVDDDVRKYYPDANAERDAFFRYSYVDEKTNIRKTGKPLAAPKWILRKHKLPLKYLDALTDDNVQDFVFVLGCTEDHYNESKDAIATVQKFFPTHDIIYYDWGLSAKQVADLKTLCKVHYRKFDFMQYPATRKQEGRPRYQSAKIFCIMDTLIDQPGVFWIDASIRFMNSFVFKALWDGAVANQGYGFMFRTDHSSFAVTHPHMYDYFPTDMEEQKKQLQGASFSILMYKTKVVYESIIWWWFLCGLNFDCMSPTMNLICDFKNNRMTRWGNCHRFDQSNLNILAHNAYHYNDTIYNFEYQVKYRGGFDVQRDSWDKEKPVYC